MDASAATAATGPALAPGRVRHHIPGRTRIETVAPFASPRRLPLEQALARRGWTLCSFSPPTRTVLVRHPPERSPAEVVDAVVEGLFAGPQPEAAGAPGDPELEAVMAAAAEAAPGLVGSSAAGLSEAEAARRLAASGRNVTPAFQRRSRVEIISAQLTTLPVGLLAGSAVLSLATGGMLDAVVTLAVVAINAGIGYATEDAVERLIARLSAPVAHKATVVREGRARLAPAAEVAPGDLIALAPGDAVAADARLIEANELTIDESILTGESLGVEKSAAPSPRPGAPLAERRNMVHAGTVVTGGQGLAVAVRTGARTEAAGVRALVSSARPPKPVIEEKLDELSRTLVLGALAGSGVVLGVGLALRHPLVQTLRTAVSLAVASMPEGLPAVATTTFALEAREMERRGVYVRLLPSIESLGVIDTLCLDKTGTLTENRMTVAGAAAGSALYGAGAGRLTREDGVQAEEKDRRALTALAEAVSLCNSANGDSAGGAGSATELALLEFAQLVGLDVTARRLAMPWTALRERSQRRRFMSTLHEKDGEQLLFLKGAPEDVLALCGWERRTRGRTALTPSRRAEILGQNESLAARGQRVLGVARQRGRNGAFDADQPADLEWLGLVGLSDPVRPKARQAIETFQRAGVRTVMITGDQPVTARAVAETLNLSGGEIVRVLTGPEIAGMDEATLGAHAAETTVFARAAPADKLRIVRALQSAGAVVGALGDGVNDGPALREARVGIAMGRRGSDVAREVADVVIADDDLEALARAVARGRATDDNIRNAVRFLLSTNLSEMLVMLVEAFGPPGEQETPLELFWINLVTDILPAIGLATAEPAGDVMQRSPASMRGPIIPRSEVRRLGLDAVQLAAVGLIAHAAGRGLGGPGPAARGPTFLTLAGAQLAHAFALRDRSPGDAHAKTISTRRLELAVGASAGLLAAPFVFPTLRRAMGATPILASELGLSAALIGTSMLVSEARRRF